MTGGCVGVLSWEVGVGRCQGNRAVSVSSNVAKGTLREGARGNAASGVESPRTSERQRTRGLRTGATVGEFGSTGISEVSGIGSSVMASSTGSSATGVGVNETSPDVEGPSYWGSRDAPGGQRSKYVRSVSRRESKRS